MQSHYKKVDDACFICVLITRQRGKLIWLPDYSIQFQMSGVKKPFSDLSENGFFNCTQYFPSSVKRVKFSKNKK